MTTAPIERALRGVLAGVGPFSRGLLGAHALRPYQEEVARAIVESVRRGDGKQFAIVFARQAGKDETIAQTLAFLLATHWRRGGSIVVAAPTFRPQSLVSRARLLERLDHDLKGRLAPAPKVEAGFIVRLGRATARFLSAAPGANVRGETASLLLVCNEAQDVDPDRWDAVFDPMAAATNATTVFSGTVWSDRTLLARQMRHLRDLERRDGQRRVFLVPWTRVAEDVPAYGERVRARIAQFGADHPFIRTEYALRELAGAGGLFGPARRAQLQGDHPRQRRAEPGRTYALLIDVAGEDEAIADAADRGAEARALGTRRDATALTVIEVGQWANGPVAGDHRRDAETQRPAERGRKGDGIGDTETRRATRGEGERLQSDHSALRIPHSAFSAGPLPSYRVVDRRLWTGARHTALHAAIVDLARNVWRARRIVVDATGVGAGLASWLAAALPGKVTAVQFSAAKKSELGWALVGAIESGRLKEYTDDGAEETRLFWRQLEAVEYEVRPGPGKLLGWGVPDPRLHDDLVLSLALVGELDEVDWRPRVARGSGGI